MSASDRLAAEAEFHDRQAAGRAARFATPEALAFEDEAYLSHESWIRPAFADLGDLACKDALDLGCGHGMAAVVLARRGARVTATDLSLGYLREAKARASANGVGVRFVKADAERLPFADGSFDRVWGNAILHHLDPLRFPRELSRILRPGGVAVFCEPYDGNPLLAWARRRLPYPGKDRTRDEAPLQRRQLDRLREAFPAMEVRGYQLASMVRRVVNVRAVVAALEACDRVVLRACPGLWRACRYVTVTVRR